MPPSDPVRKSETFVQVGARFGVSEPTARRYVDETLEVLAGWAPGLREALVRLTPAGIRGAALRLSGQAWPSAPPSRLISPTGVSARTTRTDLSCPSSLPVFGTDKLQKIPSPGDRKNPGSSTEGRFRFHGIAMGRSAERGRDVEWADALVL
ncbi:transposase family protein [Streptomyces goshikiensis]